VESVLSNVFIHQFIVLERSGWLRGLSPFSLGVGIDLACPIMLEVDKGVVRLAIDAFLLRLIVLALF